MGKVIKKCDTTLRYDDKYYDEILNQYRTIFLYEAITPSAASTINKKIIAMSVQNKKEPIVLELNSPGGNTVAGLSIIDTMRIVKSPVYTLIKGYAASMASVISIMGVKRYMTKNAYFMMHPMTAGGNSDYFPFIKDELKWFKQINKQVIQIYKDYTDIPEKLISKCQHGEIWLTSKECLKYNIIDKIL